MQFLGDRKRIWLGVSLALFIISIAALVYWKLPFGIDFKGGAVLEVKTGVQTEELRLKVGESELGKTAIVTGAEQGSYIIKLQPLTEEQHQQVVGELKQKISDLEEVQFQTVGPSVSKDLTNRAIRAIVIAAVAIILYLAYAFRGLTKPIASWRFGVIAVIALLHDLIITAGVFAALAHFLHYEIDASLITAMLTVMGFSVHDTIVVFDRVRENSLKQHPGTALEFEQIADRSLGETLNRSLATSFTVLITLGALFLLGGESIKPFVLVLLLGIAIGTYSSIFTATPLLAIWQSAVFSRSSRR